ncbi:MAG: hypothetical protein WAL26_30765, partial [Mycobacterium sp.]
NGGVALDLPATPDSLARVEEDGDVEAGSGQPAVQRQQAVDDDEVVGLDEFWPDKPAGAVIVDRLENGLAGSQQLQMLLENLDVVAVRMLRRKRFVPAFFSVEPVIVVGGQRHTPVRPERIDQASGNGRFTRRAVAGDRQHYRSSTAFAGRTADAKVFLGQ